MRRLIGVEKGGWQQASEGSELRIVDVGWAYSGKQNIPSIWILHSSGWTRPWRIPTTLAKLSSTSLSFVADRNARDQMVS